MHVCSSLETSGSSPAAIGNRVEGGGVVAWPGRRLDAFAGTPDLMLRNPDCEGFGAFSVPQQDLEPPLAVLASGVVERPSVFTDEEALVRGLVKRSPVGIEPYPDPAGAANPRLSCAVLPSAHGNECTITGMVIHLGAFVQERGTGTGDERVLQSRHIEVEAPDFASGKRFVIDQLPPGWIVASWRVSQP